MDNNNQRLNLDRLSIFLILFCESVMATEDSATAYGIRNNESGTSENLNFHSSGFDIKRKDIHDTIS